MNWFAGNIAEAVNLSKSKNAIFVVYVEGQDDLSAKITALINHDNIRKYLESNHFVAIKIQSGSEAYMQFAQIYQLVPLPSLFFIGRNGTPLQVVTGVTNTIEELEEKIVAVLTSTGIEVANINIVEPKSSPIVDTTVTPDDQVQGAAGYTKPEAGAQPTSTDTITKVVCDGDVCVKVETKQSDANAIETQKTMDEKLKKAQELVEKQRREKEAEEKEAERERELKRRVEGQKLLDLKKWQEEQEMKQLKEDRKKEKQQEQEARRRILLQIEQDRLERAQRFGQTIPAAQTPATESAPKPVITRPASDSNSNFARIQFKKPGGDIEMHTFECSDTFLVLRTYVEQNILPGSGIRDFKLATTFPRREFTSADYESSLRDLGLSPTAVLLILPLSRSSNGSNVVSTTSRSVYEMAYTIVWNLFTPFMAVFGYVKNLIFNRQPNRRDTSGAEKRSNEERLSDHDAAKRRNLRLFENQQPSTSGASASSSPRDENKGAYRRVGSSNVHQLHESRDSDEDNNTWNGNSTQQQ